MGFTESRCYRTRLYVPLVLALMSVALTFLIVAVSLHDLYSLDFSDVPPDVQASYNVSVSGHNHFGAFLQCADMDAVSHEPDGSLSSWSIHQCATIQHDCTSTFTVVDGAGSEVTLIDDPAAYGFSCAHYNAFRAFLVMGIVALGLALLGAALSMQVWRDKRWLMWVTVGWCVYALVCVVISYSLVASYTQKSAISPYLTTGAAFALAVTAWCLMVIALVMFGMVKHFEREDYSKDIGEEKVVA